MTSLRAASVPSLSIFSSSTRLGSAFEALEEASLIEKVEPDAAAEQAVEPAEADEGPQRKKRKGKGKDGASWEKMPGKYRKVRLEHHTQAGLIKRRELALEASLFPP